MGKTTERQGVMYEFIERKRIMFFGLPFTFTKYSIGPEKLNIKRGFLSITEDDAYMYKVQDVRLTKSFWERIFHLGTIICFTGDTTDPKLELKHIKHSNEIKEYLLSASEEARLRRRTRYNVNTGVDLDDDDQISEEDGYDDDENDNN